MRIEELLDKEGWSDDFKEIIMRATGDHEDFNKMQSDFIKWGGLDKERVIVSAPTASGKTLLAILGILKKFHDGNQSFIYLVPYTSIKDEKYSKLKEIFNSLLSVKKDYDGLSDLHNGEEGIVISDFSTFDRYSRNIQDFNLGAFYIFDEIDVLGNEFFGPSVEGSIARLLRKGELNLLTISATISEDIKLKDWFNAEFFRSTYRPVTQNEEVLISDDFHQEICDLFLNDERTQNKSILVMIYNKRIVMSYAKKISSILETRSSRILQENDINTIIGRHAKTKMILNLIGCLKFGVAFHHADLHNTIRRKIIDYYNANKIKIIICTPTLLRGVNLRTRTVVLPNPKVYNSQLRRSIPISYIDYLQCKGRAGRPQYEDEAYLFILADNDAQRERLESRYLEGEMENLVSGFIDFRGRLKSNLLDKQILIEFYQKSRDFDEIVEIFSHYYFAIDNQGDNFLEKKINSRLQYLMKNNLIEKNIQGEITISLLGDYFLMEIEKLNVTIKKYLQLLDLALDIITDRFDFDDRFHYKILNKLLEAIEPKKYIRIRSRGSNKEEIETQIRNLLRSKCGIHKDIISKKDVTLICLIEYISHTSLEEIDQRFGVDSTKLDSVVKLKLKTYIKVLIELIAYLVDNLDLISIDEPIELGEEFERLTTNKISLMLDYLGNRVYYGVKFELAPIVTIKGIGNYRGIALYNALRNRFRGENDIDLDWRILEEYKEEILRNDIEGWGSQMKEKLYENLEGVLNMERRLKNLLDEFAIEYTFI